MDKTRLPSQALRAEIEQQLRLVPILKVALEQDTAFELTIGSPQHHERDLRGRNWDVAGFRSGFVFWPQCHGDFRLIVDRLRQRYDMV